MYENSMALCVTDKCTFRRDKHGASSAFSPNVPSVEAGATSGTRPWPTAQRGGPRRAMFRTVSIPAAV
jgi:hypothetical protein